MVARDFRAKKKYMCFKGTLLAPRFWLILLTPKIGVFSRKFIDFFGLHFCQCLQKVLLREWETFLKIYEKIKFHKKSWFFWWFFFLDGRGGTWGPWQHFPTNKKSRWNTPRVGNVFAFLKQITKNDTKSHPSRDRPVFSRNWPSRGEATQGYFFEPSPVKKATLHTRSYQRLAGAARPQLPQIII